MSAYRDDKLSRKLAAAHNVKENDELKREIELLKLENAALKQDRFNLYFYDKLGYEYKISFVEQYMIAMLNLLHTLGSGLDITKAGNKITLRAEPFVKAFGKITVFNYSLNELLEKAEKLQHVQQDNLQ